MSGKIKNQHYVPRMYMKRFTQDNSRLSVWNLVDDKILSRQRPENYATRRYFYDAEKTELKEALAEMIKAYPSAEPIIDAADEQLLEKGLSRLEADVASILDDICKNDGAMYAEDNMKKLLIFLHTLAYRSEKYREQLDDIRTQTITHLEGFGVSADQVKGLGQTGKNDQLYRLLGISPLLKTAKMLMENYNWYMGTVAGSQKLIISDNPAQGIILGFNDICIPLNGSTAIIFRIADPESPILSEDFAVGKETKLSDRSVFAYNAVQLSYANRFVFGDKNSLLFLKSMCDRNGGYAKMVGDKPRLNIPH